MKEPMNYVDEIFVWVLGIFFAIVVAILIGAVVCEFM